MAIQAFIDDSGGRDTGPHVVLAGQIASAVLWADFAEAWDVVLKESPSVRSFKMDDAVGRNNSWHRLTKKERDDKLYRLARVISRYGFEAIHCTTEWRAFDTSIGKGLAKPFNDPLFMPFHILTMSICHDLLAHGQRYRFEIFFDNHRLEEKVRRFHRLCYAVAPPEEQAILPVEPLFRNDDTELPLQAADMLAWFFRRRAYGADPKDNEFDWLLPTLFTIPVSPYSSTFIGDAWKPKFAQIYTHSAIDKIVNAWDDLYGT